MSGSNAPPLRVLIIAAQEPWPLDHGGRLRLFHVVDGLARRAEVTLAIPDPPAHREQFSPALCFATMTGTTAAVRQRNGRASHWFTPLARRYFGHNPQIASWLRRNARRGRFDVALLSGPPLGHYADCIRIPVVWDPADDLALYMIRNAEYARPHQWLSAVRQAAFQVLYERAVCSRIAATIFCSPVDAAYARRWCGGARVEVAAGGVDAEYFHPDRRTCEPGTVVFVGAFDFPPNVDGIVHFTRHIWPRVYAGGAARRLLIVGRRPGPQVRALAGSAGVEVVGTVPDVRPFLTRAAVVVVPTRLGGGMKNKVLEACAVQRPVVASPRAMGGLSARMGRDVLCANDDPAWVRQVTRLLEDPARADRIARAGHRWVRQAHRWPHTVDRFEQILESVAAGKSSRAASGLEATKNTLGDHVKPEPEQPARAKPAAPTTPDETPAPNPPAPNLPEVLSCR